jgi:serine/threonine protein kinase/Tfp pilus assembly protein PilF
MIRVIRICRKCGAKIFSDAPEGLCTGCVLETVFGILPDGSVAAGDDCGSAEDSQTNNAAFTPHVKTTARVAKMLGELGDYQLLEEIGRGGQGVVFRARQKSLNRTVALKVIGLGQWATKAHLRRFRLEAEAAASLDHPCIVPIYEVGERDGSCYFSMKFVEGGQLDEVVKHTPISIRQATGLIAKVARTVHYAHEHGILHRDIKPGNILLDAKGEPHLTDFGLARLVEAESTVTRTLEVMGTPSYMAPEQAAGNNTKLASATDVYGLGAVLYQLLTAHPPFAGGTTYETVRLVLETEPRQPRLLNRKVDRDLSTICLKCLEKDPQRRYCSALALAEDLERWLKYEPIRAKRSGFFTHARKWVRRNPSTAGLIALSLAFAAAVCWNVWKSDLLHRPPTTGIAVLPFENLSNNTEDAYLAEGIQDEILTRLSKIADLKVISRTSTQHYKSAPDNLPEIAKQLGVAHILEGSVQKSGPAVRVNVQLIKADDDSHLWADSFDRKLTDLFSVESEVARTIADQLRVHLTSREEQAIDARPTNNPEAYDAYLRGLVFQARGFFSDDIIRKAISFYERAVQLDPNFALAWARLSRANSLVYLHSDDKSAARRDASKKALDNAQKLQPNSSETLLALGYYQYYVLADYELAKSTFQLVGKLSPSNSEVAFALGSVNRREGKWNESLACVEQALAFDPRNGELITVAAYTYGLLRQFPTALKLYDRAMDIVAPDPDLLAGAAGVYQAQGNLEQAAKLLSEITAETPFDGAFFTKTNQLRLERNHIEAVRLLQARLAQFHFTGDVHRGITQVFLAFAQRFARDTAGAKATADQARNTLEPLCKNQPDNPNFATWLALAHAVLGEKDPAIKEAERAIMLLPTSKDAVDGPALEEKLALIQAMFGENSRAISTLRRLLQTPFQSQLYGPAGFTPALLRLDPLWDPLRAEPAFQKLCEEK